LGWRVADVKIADIDNGSEGSGDFLDTHGVCVLDVEIAGDVLAKRCTRGEQGED
jgi:hypothetical protein